MVFCLHFTCCRSLHVAPILVVMLRFTSNAWIDALKCTIDILLGGISLTSRSQGTCSQCIDIDIYGHEGYEHMVIGMQAGSVTQHHLFIHSVKDHKSSLVPFRIDSGPTGVLFSPVYMIAALRQSTSSSRGTSKQVGKQKACSQEILGGATLITRWPA